MTSTFAKPWAGVTTSGSPALSFVNTLDWRLRNEPVELLHDYEDLLRWARTVELLTPAQAHKLRAEVGNATGTGPRILKRAIELRESLATVFLAVAAGESLPESSVERLDAVCGKARAAQRLSISGDSVLWTWRSQDPEPERPTWGAALAATDLLTSSEVHRVRLCGDDECGWFFLDTSKNRSRRWCSMESCGNRNKARRFYRRSRGS